MASVGKGIFRNFRSLLSLTSQHARKQPAISSVFRVNPSASCWTRQLHQCVSRYQQGPSPLTGAQKTSVTPLNWKKPQRKRRTSVIEDEQQTSAGISVKISRKNYKTLI